MLEKKVLGKTGLRVSALALGGLCLRGKTLNESCAVIRRAWELGINYIDTAPSYGDSEEVVGEALSQMDADFILSTKIGDLPAQDYRGDDIVFLRERLERSYARLRRNKVNMLMIHEPDRQGEFFHWWDDPVNYTGPVLDLLREFQENGRTDFIGLGGTTVTEMTHLIDSGKFDVVLTAFQYSLLFQEASDTVLPVAQRQRMGIVAGSPLQQGAFAAVYDEGLRHHQVRWLSEARRKQFLKLYDLVNDCKIPLPELALRFVLSDDRITSVLTGAANVAELEANVAAAEKGALPEALLSEIRTIYRMVPFRPYGEPMGLVFQPRKER